VAVAIYQAIKENGKALWPEQRPIEWLDRKRSTMPRSMFNSQYQNDPSGLRGVRYDLSWLKYYTDTTRPPLRELVGFQSGDPATSTSESSNYFGHCTVGKHLGTGLIYVLSFAFGHIPATEHLEFLRSQYDYWTNRGLSIQNVLLEEVGPQQATTQNLAAQTRTDSRGAMPLSVFHPKGSKEQRLDSILVYLGNGQVLFPGDRADGSTILRQSRDFDEFRREWTSFPKGRRDDLLDALFMVISETAGIVVGDQIRESEVSQEERGSAAIDLTDMELYVSNAYFNLGDSIEDISLATGHSYIEILQYIQDERERRRGDSPRTDETSSLMRPKSGIFH